MIPDDGQKPKRRYDLLVRKYPPFGLNKVSLSKINPRAINPQRSPIISQWPELPTYMGAQKHKTIEDIALGQRRRGIVEIQKVEGKVEFLKKEMEFHDTNRSVG